MRRRAKRENVGVALFPFLAVLICTMGALIVLLVMNVQQASVEAKTIAAEKGKAKTLSAEDAKKQKEALEDARWRQEILEQQRKERQEKLQETRLALSHLEDHIRRLNSRGKELMKLLEKVKAGKQAQENDLEAKKTELAKIKDQLAKKRDELDQKKKDAKAAGNWYALIPYDGPNGTRRMPIYVECVEEGVIVQPEGVLLSAADFRGEPGPGNPLDAALRTKREYIMKATGGKAAEPYPLLVVRPSGILAYTAARSFMKFWDDEFGYELISEDKKLDFGPRDPNLDMLMHREIAQARKRQAVLAMDMPRKYNGEEIPRSFAPEDNAEVQRRRATLGGGGVGTGGGGAGLSGLGTAGHGGNGSAGNGLANTGPARRPGTTGNGGVGVGPGGRGDSFGTPTGGQSGVGPYGTTGDLAGKSGSGSGGTGTGSGGGGGGSGGSVSGTANSGGAKNNLRLSQPGQSNANPGAGNFAGGTAGGTSESGSASQPGSTGSASSSASGNTMGGSGGTPTASGTSGGSAGGGAGGIAGSTGSPGSPQTPTSPNINVNLGPQEAPRTSTASKTKSRGGSGDSRRGKNWGLPEAQRHVTGVTRPIRLSMQKDKLVLVPERSDVHRAQEIPLSPEISSQELETLISGIHRQMRSWGIAVDGGYWKPALSVDVQPGAEDRFAELQSALQGSGIEVQRKLR